MLAWTVGAQNVQLQEICQLTSVIVANIEAANQAVTAASTTAATTTVATIAKIATGNAFKAKQVKLKLPGKFEGDPSKL